MNKFEILDKFNSKFDEFLDYTKKSNLIKREETDNKCICKIVVGVVAVMAVAALGYLAYKLYKNSMDDIYYYDDELDDEFEDEYEDLIDDETEVEYVNE